MATWQEHLEISQRFRAQGFAEIESGDLLQGSEKLWGAAAHAVKAIAEQRGWRHDSHRQLFSVVNRLSSEMGTPEFARMFRVAGELHINFYEAAMGVDAIHDTSASVDDFLGRLRQLTAEGDSHWD